jgi:hypothetical protein
MDLKRKLSRRNLLKGAAGGAFLLGKTKLASASDLPTGPSTTTIRSYVLPSIPGVHILPILTAGETAENGYRMVGIPDGLGAINLGETFEVYMNHEITGGDNPGSSGPGPGIVRAHGSDGAFVSKWTIDSTSLRVLKGEDLTRAGQTYVWNSETSTYATANWQWQRLCSADLPDRRALLFGQYGTAERIFLNGEEISGVPSSSAPRARFGSAWARIVTGTHAGEAWELPRLGKLSIENVVACPHGRRNTIVALFDDGSIDTGAAASSNPSEVFIYIGTKQSSGSEIEKAGLTNGKLYGLRVLRGADVVNAESNDYGFGTSSTGFIGSATFELAELGSSGDVSNLNGLQLEQDAMSKNVFRLLRPEDGAWDPRATHPNTLYFVTTGAIASSPGTGVNMNSRLWRLKFYDIENPLLGGKIEILLSGKELSAPGWRMFDNITIDRYGRLLLQEDTGNNPWVSKIWVYGIDSETLTEIAHHDPALFDPNFVGPGTASPDFITQDEESSGIIDAESVLGRGWFLFDVQNHWAYKGQTPPVPDPNGLVEGGQLLAMYVDPKIGTPRQHARASQHLLE